MSDERSTSEGNRGRIITFYSYKGGVGRSMALANIALLLAHLGNKVLVIDWDLEAPGLDRYFRPHFLGQPKTPGGLLRLLETAGSESDPFDYESYSHGIDVKGFAGFQLLSSGDDQPDYARRLANFSWVDFFEKKNGGAWLDRLRERWQRDYRFVLIDSRTGVTDAGGVCTIKLPDQLVFVLTANQQNLDGCRRVIGGIHQARLEDPSDPARLLIFPLLSRYDGRVETDLADEWLQKCAELFAPVVADWLDKGSSPPGTGDVSLNEAQRQEAACKRTAALLRRTKLPHVPRYAFGEELAVLRDSHDDPERLPYYYSAVGQILIADFHADAELLHGATAATALATEEVRKSAIEQQKAAEEIARLEQEKIESEKRVQELEKLRQQVFEDAAQTARKRTASGFRMLALAGMILVGAVLYLERDRFRSQTEFEGITEIVEAVATEYQRDKPATDAPDDPNRLQRAIEKVAAEKKLSADKVRANVKSYPSQVEVAKESSFAAHALSEFTQSARQDEITAWMAKADSARDENNLKEVETAYRAALALTDSVTDAALWKEQSERLAETLEEGEQYEEALRIRRNLLTQAERRSPSSSQEIYYARFLVARTLQDLGRHGDAETLFREALKLAEENPSLRESIPYYLIFLGDSLLELGKISEAESLFGRSLSLLSNEKTRRWGLTPNQIKRFAKNLPKLDQSPVAKPLFQNILFAANTNIPRSDQKAAAIAAIETTYRSFLQSQGLSREQIEQEISAAKTAILPIPSEFRTLPEATKPAPSPTPSRPPEQRKTENVQAVSPLATPPP